MDKEREMKKSRRDKEEDDNGGERNRVEMRK